MNWSDAEAIRNCAAQLDAIGADDRVLVINAAYETDIISESFVAGAHLDATHAVFTHLDETRKAGKLWKYALSRDIHPLFFSHGPNPAGDYSMDPMSYLLERTFPQGREIASARKNDTSADDSKAVDREVVAVA